MTQVQKLLVVFSALVVLGAVYYVFETRGDTTIGKTLRVNDPLNQSLLVHYSFDSTALNIGSTTAEVIDVSGAGRNGDSFVKSTSTLIFNATSTSASSTFYVPSGVTSIAVQAWGAGGGGGGGGSLTGSDGGQGGGGGYVLASNVTVTPGEALSVVVGGGGGGGAARATCVQAGGGGGGGYSGVHRDATFLVIAPGGGGGGSGSDGATEDGGAGGPGGGASGTNGHRGYVNTGGNGGGGATQTAGGTAGAGGTTGGDGAAGALRLGATGGQNGTTCAGGAAGAIGGGTGGGAAATQSGGGGGGGGGSYGGGSGEAGILSTNENAGGGGGGGSSYATGTATSTTAGSGRNAGNNTDANYVTGVGAGAATTTASTGVEVPGGFGGRGHVVISYAQMTPTLGTLGQALSFDGIDDYIATSTTGTMNGVQSVAFWIRTATTTGRQDIMNFLAANTTYIWTTANGTLTATGFSSPTIYIDGTAGTILPNNEWHHIVVTTATPINATSFLVGRASTTKSLGGSLDDVRVYSKELTAAEVTRLYGLGATTKVGVTLKNNTVLKNGLVAHWTYDGTTTVLSSVGSTTIYDLSGNNNTGKSTIGLGEKPGAIGQGIEFDGVDDYVEFANSATLDISGNAVTVATWLKTYGFASHQTIIDKPKSATAHSSPYYSYALSLQNTADASHAYQIQFLIADSPTTDTRAYSSTKLRTDAWYHVVGVYDGATMQVYINGVADGSPAALTVNLQSYNTPLRIGTNGGFTEDLNGVVDDTRVYNRALSAAEIQRLYGLGATTKVGVTQTNNPALENGLVLHYTFDGKDVDWSSTTAEVRDVSGNAKHGNATTSLVATTSPTVGVLGQAFEFNGTSDDIRSTLTTHYSRTSFSFWIKPLSYGEGQYGRIIDKSDNITQICTILLDGPNNQLRFYRGTSGIKGDWYIPFPVTYIGAQVPWRHVVVTYDESVLSVNTPTFYLDGVEVAESVITQPDGAAVVDTNTEAYHIGNRGDAGRTWDGAIDDVRIYNRILSAAEAKRLYEMGR